MEQYLNDIIEFLLPRNDLFLYGFLFLSAVIENLFPPIPGDTITVFGAFMVGTGRLAYLPVYLATTAGSVCGFILLVLAGRLVEREFFMRKNYRFFPAATIIRAEQWFGRYGYFVVLANRFLPGIRSVISLVAGISRMNLWYVLLLAGISASVWNLIWIQAGFLLGNNWDTVKEQAGQLLQSYNMAVGIVFTLALTAYITYRIVRSRNKTTINKK